MNERPACVFYDMQNSNNAARIRLWLYLKGIEDPLCPLRRLVKIKKVTFKHLSDPDYKLVNPLGKVPAFLTDKGTALFESFVILQYLEDRFPDLAPSLVPDNPDDRAVVQLLIRVHDIYISSPNCTQPHFSHTQGCMYLAPVATEHCPESRTMNAETRAAKLAEIHKWLTWLEKHIAETPKECGGPLHGDLRLGPFLAPGGKSFSNADITWFPSAVFMEYHLPRVFGWGPIFHEQTHFPLLTKWFESCNTIPQFAWIRREILDVLERPDFQPRVHAVKKDVQDHPEYKWKFM